jgi:excisionase family DNA binding protein
MNKYQFEKTDRDFYMDVLMVSEYLHFAKSTIYKWVEESHIPHKKLGKRVLFIKSEIDQWVMNNGMIAVDDLPEVPKFMAIGKDNLEETQDTIRHINQRHKVSGNINFKYRSAS